MAEAHLPEDIIVNILSRLPVKSLVRFSCVSKRLHFIIFSDPKFAGSQFKAACEQKTLSRRLLLSTYPPQLLSLDLQTPSFGDNSSVRKLNFPFQQPGRFDRFLGSCNGLVFVAFDENFFYIWNPSIGFFKELPDPGFSPVEYEKELSFYGVGYVSATDDYKVFVASLDFTEKTEEVEMFSLRAHVWRRIQVPGDFHARDEGTLLNEALHWINEGVEDEIVVFDLAQEEFRKMRLPNFYQRGILFLINLGVSFGGCLCVCRRCRDADVSIEFWIMREYDVRGDSWTKLFNLKLSNPTLELRHSRYLLVMESSLVFHKLTCNGTTWLVRIDQKEEEKIEMFMTEAIYIHMIPYEESLLWIND